MNTLYLSEQMAAQQMRDLQAKISQGRARSEAVEASRQHIHRSSFYRKAKYGHVVHLGRLVLMW